MVTFDSLTGSLTYNIDQIPVANQIISLYDVTASNSDMQTSVTTGLIVRLFWCDYSQASGDDALVPNQAFLLGHMAPTLSVYWPLNTNRNSNCGYSFKIYKDNVEMDVNSLSSWLQVI